MGLGSDAPLLVSAYWVFILLVIEHVLGIEVTGSFPRRFLGDSSGDGDGSLGVGMEEQKDSDLARRGSKHTAYKLPPGPVPLPIIGNLLNLGNRPHESLANLAKTYGPIMTLKLGYVTTIVISSAPMAKEVLQKQDLSFCNRSIPDAIRAANHNQLSMAWIPVSTTWRALRRTCNSHLFTSQKLDSNTHLRHQKVQELLANVEQSCQAGGPVDICREAFRTSLNLLSNAIFSVDLVDQFLRLHKSLKSGAWCDGGSWETQLGRLFSGAQTD
ncbi:Geraniol 8-hydroxylase [Vitis vinifera]|uniref:Geraniol 8-hydroxylase n=1 Tax=Vitis vinifera TaxID=29760 RepID=A0A438JJF6_VITVI|nr:Geraniol 8-hydroxylase [Vitis vinifera]